MAWNWQSSWGWLWIPNPLPLTSFAPGKIMPSLRGEASSSGLCVCQASGLWLGCISCSCCSYISEVCSLVWWLTPVAQTQEAEAEGSGIQDRPGLHNKNPISLQPKNVIFIIVWKITYCGRTRKIKVKASMERSFRCLWCYRRFQKAWVMKAGGGTTRWRWTRGILELTFTSLCILGHKQPLIGSHFENLLPNKSSEGSYFIQKAKHSTVCSKNWAKGRMNKS